MPAELRAEWAAFLELKDEVARRQCIQDYLDAGRGSCVLRDAKIGGLVESALLHFDGSRYRLLAWVVMPNHVHAVLEILAGQLLSKILHSWKSFAANEANKILHRVGMLWQPEYFDRYVRNERHLKAAIDYVEQNPVIAGLVKRAEDWPFSSARLRVNQLGSAGILPAISGAGAGRMPALPGK